MTVDNRTRKRYNIIHCIKETHVAQHWFPYGGGYAAKFYAYKRTGDKCSDRVYALARVCGGNGACSALREREIICLRSHI